MVRSLTSLIPTADELLALDEERLAMVLLIHLDSYKTMPGNPVFQQDSFSKTNFLATRTSTLYGYKHEFGNQQGNVNKALMDAWSWLEQNNYLRRAAEAHLSACEQLTRKGEDRITQLHKWEEQGVKRVGSDSNQPLAWLWAGLERLKADSRKQQSTPFNDTLISEGRLTELRTLKSPEFDFKKLIRLCEEININYQQGCYLGAPMLTRSLLDHVPPIFQKSSFTEVANQYGTRSFKGTMQHLDTGARNIADGHLHSQIRKKETLPEPQQVDFRAGLDVLLGEIIRLTEEKHGN